MTVDMLIYVIVFPSGGERGICTNISVFLQEEKENVNICTNFCCFSSG